VGGEIWEIEFVVDFEKRKTRGYERGGELRSKIRGKNPTTRGWSARTAVPGEEGRVEWGNKEI